MFSEISTKNVGHLGNKGNTFPKSNFPQTNCHTYESFKVNK